MTRSQSASKYVALLRGVNVGGRNLIAMPDIAEMFIRASCTGVRTYIQSGNVVFSAAKDVAEKLPSRIEKEIWDRCFCRTTVILRSAAQVRAIIRNNPFLKAGAADNMLHVMFLAGAPEPARAASLDPDRSPPDAFIVRGQEIYLQLPNGAGRSKLTNSYFDAKLATVSTMRNWRTVVTLSELMTLPAD